MTDSPVRDVLEHTCDITFFIACYNEEGGIIPTLDTVVAAATEAGLTYDIVVIDDCSKDKSVELVRDYIALHPDIPINLVVNKVNGGFGSNFAEGAFHGSGKYYKAICGDNVESKETLASLFRHIGEADLILPYHTNVFRGADRRIISTVYTALINLITGNNIRYYNGLSIARRYDVMRWHSNSHGFGFQADLVTRLLDLGTSYIEVPIQGRERDSGSTKAFTFKNICSVAHTLLDISIRRFACVVYAKEFAKQRQYRQGLASQQTQSAGTPQTADSPVGQGAST